MPNILCTPLARDSVCIAKVVVRLFIFALKANCAFFVD